ncbi:MAG: hypothetical protein SFY66_26750 [Oculatellaceae cyanobacterium bins.114]|nr:hypothetical protein [Oculatellaceae cyanobacterium bins.114]
MIETLLIFVGTAIALYLLLGLLEQSVKWFRQFVFKNNTDTCTATSTATAQGRKATICDGLASASQTFPADLDWGVAQCDTHIDVCPATPEAVSSFAEGMQGVLDGSGEHVGKLVESAIHAVSEL